MYEHPNDPSTSEQAHNEISSTPEHVPRKKPGQQAIEDAIGQFRFLRIEASVDTVHLFIRFPWSGLRTQLESLYGRRVRIEDIFDKETGEIYGVRIELHQPSKAMLAYIASLDPPTLSPQGPWARRRITLSRVEVAIDYWFATQAEADAFRRFVRLHSHLKWMPRDAPWHQEPGGDYVVDYETRGGKETEARNLIVYDLTNSPGYHRRSRIKVATLKIPHQPIDPQCTFSEQKYAIRLELKLKKSRSVRANGLTLRSLEHIDIAKLFNHNICLLYPKPMFLRRTMKGSRYGWNRFLRHRVIHPQSLLSLPFLLPIPPQLTIPDLIRSQQPSALVSYETSSLHSY